jgi:hypothetical protein
MAEIDNWIKKQLKKGYKKEQIKNSLRKAGYPYVVVNSVDSSSKKQQMQKIFLVLAAILFIIISVILIINYKPYDKSYESEPTNKDSEGLPPIYFKNHYPETEQELKSFINFCTGLLNQKENYDALCAIDYDIDNSVYIPVYTSSDFRVIKGMYILIAVRLDKMITEKGYPENETYNICSVNKPKLKNKIEIESNLERTLVFTEGDIFCSEPFKIDKPFFASFTGFIPDSNTFNAYIYLVDEDDISKVLSKDSFPDAEQELKKHEKIWELEKEIY